ncbi:MAG TPA: helix-turn-helix transcriptional regulator [Candidatus Blautia faecipullorum]|nr:helix-turn-helix transcriptional regulator [Candidatus Blautia faecipullorum]
MAITYNKLWKLLIDKGMTKVQLKEITGMGPGTLAKLGKNQRVSLEVLERICKELHCNFGDIIDYKEEH